MIAPQLVDPTADTDHQYTALTPAVSAACNRRAHHRSHPAMPNSTIEPVRDNGAATDAANRTIQAGSETKCPKSATDDMPEQVVSLVRRGKLDLDIRCASPADLPAVLELIDEAKLWLPSKYTDQWSKDWADQKGRKRSDRVQDSLAQGTTWIVTVTHEKQPYAVATVTIEPNGNPLVWDRPGDLDDPAAYLSRLVVARRFAGLRIGASLLNWACDHARRRYQAELLRIDVWTRNFALHKYYRAQHFRWQGYCRDTSYTSCARFQRFTGKKTRRAPRIVDQFDKSKP
jgi:ribosomal protein S18 acetylase RimI-like enzyme